MPINFGPSDKAVNRRIVTRGAGAGTVRAIFEVSGKPRAVIHLDSQDVYMTDIEGWPLYPDGTDQTLLERALGANDVVGWAPLEVWIAVPSDPRSVGAVFRNRQEAVGYMGQAAANAYLTPEPVRVEVPQ